MRPTRINFTTPHIFPVGTLLFAHQHEWNSRADSNSRVLTKMRQAGADFFFAYEALIDALHTGRNQIFLCCDPETAQAVKSYVSYFLCEAATYQCLGKIKSGEWLLELPNGAVIYFTEPKSHFAGLHGNVYVSEYAWTDSPRTTIMIAQGLSMNKRYHATYYTTPSPNLEAWQEYKKLISDNYTVSMTFNVDNAAAYQNPQINGKWIKSMQSILSVEEWKMLFMCEWPHASKEHAE